MGEKDVIIPGKVKLGVIHPAVRSVPSVTVHKVPSVNSGTFVHPTVQSVPSDTVHKDPKVSPTVQSVPSDTVHKAPSSITQVYMY